MGLVVIKVTLSFSFRLSVSAQALSYLLSHKSFFSIKGLRSSSVFISASQDSDKVLVNQNRASVNAKVSSIFFVFPEGFVTYTTLTALSFAQQ